MMKGGAAGCSSIAHGHVSARQLEMPQASRHPQCHPQLALPLAKVKQAKHQPPAAVALRNLQAQSVLKLLQPQLIWQYLQTRPTPLP